ncbi:MAG: leucyl/phenylalanyl-tRNA--protein transferase [Candidatus Polarisedimenticolaceae bacterium]|nr:leucyl/phenylalanyl-tRNA--protein transferase [Candidatus Polarisedimenticolaceae bacterium]
MIYLLASDPETPFPDIESAETEPNGLLALGGDLSTTRLLNAYRAGIFPWYNDGQPILWWSPDPRTVFFPSQIRVSRSLRKSINRANFTATFDHAFSDVIYACSEPRNIEEGTWLNKEMIQAYLELHQLGFAHSVEIWQEERLVGGLYGISLGGVFFGESMFSRENDVSKLALIHLANQLVEWEHKMIDCQVYSQHLISLGAFNISRRSFRKNLQRWCNSSHRQGSWKHEPRQHPKLPKSYIK